MACQNYHDKFKIETPKYISINYHFDLYCKRKLFKSVLISVSTLVSPLFQAFILFLADRKGRRIILLWTAPIGMLGISFCIFAKSLVLMGFGFTLVNIYYTTTFSLNYIFINELLIDPLRSKASGIKTFSFAIGALGYYLFFFNKSFYSVFFFYDKL